MNTTLQKLLDAFFTGTCSPEAFLTELTAYCDATPDSSWEVLALLDQYHRRGKLSGDHFRAFRRKIEFHALGIADPGTLRKPAAQAPISPAAIHQVPVPPAPIQMAAAHSAPTTGVDEVEVLRSALEIERERSRRYRHRIETLAQYGHQHRTSSSRPDAGIVTDPGTRATSMLFTPKRRQQSAQVAAWFAHLRHLQRPRAWLAASVMVAAATVISGSSSNLGHAYNTPLLASTPVTLEAAPELTAAMLEPQVISLASGKFVVFPGAANATIQVHRTGDSSGATRFKWWTQSAGAKSGQDFIGQSQIAQFEAGETSVQLPVRILPNPRRRHTEMFYVAIGEPGDERAPLGENRRAAVFIMRAN